MDVGLWNKTWSRKYERYNRHHQAIWEAVLPFLRGKVVDLGCGPSVMYEGKNIDLTGVDWSEEGLKQAKLHYPQGKFILAEATDTGLPSCSFDTVIMLGLLDYFDDWEKVLKEARRLMKPGGQIIGTLLHGFNGHDWKSYPHITGNWHFVKIC